MSLNLNMYDKRGHIALTYQFATQHTRYYMMLLQHLGFAPFRVELLAFSDQLHLTGCCPYFRELPDAEIIPTYEVEFSLVAEDGEAWFDYIRIRDDRGQTTEVLSGDLGRRMEQSDDGEEAGREEASDRPRNESPPSKNASPEGGPAIQGDGEEEEPDPFHGVTDAKHAVQVQRQQWMRGNALHNPVTDGHTPDKACCGGVIWPEAKRRQYIQSALLSDAGVKH